MRTLALAFALLVVLPLTHGHAANHRVMSETERRAIQEVIESQLAAFQRDDGAAAFSYASPTIQRKFQSPEIFMSMVRSGYRAVYRPQQVEFRDLRLVDGVPTQEIVFVGPDNQVVTAVYLMQQQADGSWKINGVYLLKAPEAAT